MTIPAVLEVQARISSIQQRFGAPVTVSAPGGLLGASTLTTGAALAFAGDLQAAQTQIDAVGTHRPPASATGGSATGGSATGGSLTGGSLTGGSLTGGSLTGGSVTGSDVVAMARRFLGVPYVWGGNDPATGLDCSGLTELVYARLGIDIPPVSWQQARAGRPVASMSEAQPGDLLVFDNPVSHVGIYLGGRQMIHAPRPGKDVEVSSVYEPPTGIRRVLPDAPTPPAAARPTASATAGQEPAAGALSPGTPYAAQFRSAQDSTGVPARVLAALAQVESGFRADAVSPAGALGLMQLMPATAREIRADPLDPASAIQGAARLLKSHLQEFGSLELALAAYNAGGGAVRRYGGIPPYDETRNHVAKVLSILRGSSS